MRAMLAASLLTLVPAAFAAQPAAAQTPRGAVYLSLMGEPFIAPAGQSPLGMWIAKADADRNGAISLAELTIDADRFFKTLDTDGDGRIAGDEMTRYELQIAPAGLRAAAGARTTSRAKASDAERGLGEFSGRANPRRGREGLPGGMSRPQLTSSDLNQPVGSYGGGGASVPQPVAMTDTDMSGSVTSEEFARAAARRFATLDANKNGLLDSGELAGRR